MTLRERFSQKLPWYSEKDNLKKSEECEKTADEFAIEFAHWCEWQDGKAFKTFQELLEIFKKEKGL
jgi:hypothetical protein